MPLLRTLPIRRLFTSVHVATTAVALSLAAAALIAYDVWTIHDRGLRVGTAEAQMIAYNAATALVSNDRDGAVALLRTLRADTEILAAGIFKPDGVAFVTYFRDDPSVAAALVNTPPGDGYEFIGNRLLVYRTITRDGATIGSVRLLSEMPEVTVSVVRHLATAVVLFIVVMGASLPILSRLHKRIWEPIMELVSKARIVSQEKDYSVRATASGPDEIGLLARTFNAMLSQIQKREQEREQQLEEARQVPEAAPPRAEPEPARSAPPAEVFEPNVRSPAQLIEALLEAVESLRPRAELKGIRLQLAVDPRAIVIAIAPERLKRLLWNLLSNTIELTPAGDHLQVAARRTDSHVEISVSDGGGGIDPELRERVFDRVPQADHTIAGADAGRGEAMTVRHLVESYGGRVGVEGTAGRKGATFTIELPIAIAPQSVASEPAALAPAALAPHVTIPESTPRHRTHPLAPSLGKREGTRK